MKSREPPRHVKRIGPATAALAVLLRKQHSSSPRILTLEHSARINLTHRDQQRLIFLAYCTKLFARQCLEMNINETDESSRKRSKPSAPQSVYQVSKEKQEKLKQKAELLAKLEKEETNLELKELLHLAQLLASLDYGRSKLANLSFSTGFASSPGTLLHPQSPPASKSALPSSALSQ